MKRVKRRWTKLVLIPLLCVMLLLFQGCGKKNSGREQRGAEDTQNIVLLNEEDRDEAENTENREDASPGTDDYDENADYENAEDDAGYYGEEDDGFSYGEEDENSEDEYSDSGEPIDESGYSEDNDGDDEDGYSEDGEYTDGDGDPDSQGGNGYQEDDGGSSFENEYGSSGGEIEENGIYTTKEDVARYLHTYGKLPGNFMTKKQARSKGWKGGSLEKIAPGMCIGGDRYGNYERVLPDGNYHECDINTLGKKKRGPERLIYSDDGRIYYTGDHYETFTLLYGKD